MHAMASVDFKGDEPLPVLKSLETGDFWGGKPSRSSKKFQVKDGKSMGEKKTGPATNPSEVKQRILGGGEIEPF